MLLFAGSLTAIRNCPLSITSRANVYVALLLRCYQVLPLYDDAEAELAPHLAAARAFIAEARAAGGRVLVHCFAGQSRSAALLIGHLMASQRLGLLEAWAQVRAARPVARPNAGFLAQLAQYGRQLGLEGADMDAQAIEGLDLGRL